MPLGCRQVASIAATRRRRELRGADGASGDSVAAAVELSAAALGLAHALDRAQPARCRGGAALRRAHHRVGEPPAGQISQGTRPHPETIARRFGSFAAALQAAGSTSPTKPVMMPAFDNAPAPPPRDQVAAIQWLPFERA